MDPDRRQKWDGNATRLFLFGFVCFKRKSIEKHQQLKMLQAYSLPLLLGYNKNSCLVMRKASWDPAALQLFTPSWGAEGVPVSAARQHGAPHAGTGRLPNSDL